MAPRSGQKRLFYPTARCITSSPPQVVAVVETGLRLNHWKRGRPKACPNGAFAPFCLSRLNALSSATKGQRLL